MDVYPLPLLWVNHIILCSKVSLRSHGRTFQLAVQAVTKIIIFLFTCWHLQIRCWFCCGNPEGTVLHSPIVLWKKELQLQNEEFWQPNKWRKTFFVFPSIFQPNHIGHKVWSSCSNLKLWHIFVTDCIAGLTVFLCGPSCTRFHTAERMWLHVVQNISTCDLSIWMANAPHVSKMRKYEWVRGF